MGVNFRPPTTDRVNSYYANQQRKSAREASRANITQEYEEYDYDNYVEDGFFVRDFSLDILSVQNSHQNNISNYESMIAHLNEMLNENTRKLKWAQNDYASNAASAAQTGDYEGLSSYMNSALEEINYYNEQVQGINACINFWQGLIKEEKNNFYDTYSQYPDFAENSVSRIASYNITAISDPTEGNSSDAGMVGAMIFYDADGNVITPSDAEIALFLFEKFNGESLSEHNIYYDIYAYGSNKRISFNMYSDYLPYLQKKDIQILQYLINIGDEQMVNDFIRFKQEEVNYAIGAQEANIVISKIEEMINNGASDAAINTYLASVGFFDGLESFMAGIDNLANADGVLDPSQTKIQCITMYLNDKFSDEWLQRNLSTACYEIASSIGNMIPTIVASAAISLYCPALAPILGSTLMGLSSMGNTLDQSLANGLSNSQAFLYSFLVGSSEATLQYFLGGIPGLSAVDDIPGLKGFLINMGKEGMEESIQSILEPLFLTITTGEPFIIDWDAVVKSGIYGIITAGVMNGGSVVINGTLCNIDSSKIDALLSKYNGQDFNDPAVLQQLINDLNGTTVLTSYGEQKLNDKLNSVYNDLLTLNLKQTINSNSEVNIEILQMARAMGCTYEVAEIMYNNSNCSYELATKVVNFLNDLDGGYLLGEITVYENLVNMPTEVQNAIFSVIDSFSKIDLSDFEIYPVEVKGRIVNKIKINDATLLTEINNLFSLLKTNFDLNIDLDVLYDTVVGINLSIFNNGPTKPNNKQFLVDSLEKCVFNFLQTQFFAVDGAKTIGDVATNIGLDINAISFLNEDGSLDLSKLQPFVKKMNNFNTRVIYKYNEVILTNTIYQMLSDGKSVFEIASYASTARNSVREVSQSIMNGYIDPLLKQGTNGWNKNYKTSFLNQLFKVSGSKLQDYFIEFIRDSTGITSQNFSGLAKLLQEKIVTDEKVEKAVVSFYDTIMTNDGKIKDTIVTNDGEIKLDDITSEKVETSWLNVIKGSVSANAGVDASLGLERFQNEYTYAICKLVLLGCDNQQIDNIIKLSKDAGLNISGTGPIQLFEYMQKNPEYSYDSIEVKNYLATLK